MNNKITELYYLESIDWEEFNETMEEKFIFSWKNWWFYFSEKVHNDCEKIENVELVEWNFNKKDPIWIDYDNSLDLNLIYSKNG